MRKHLFDGDEATRHWIELVIVPSFEPEEIVSLEGDEIGVLNGSAWSPPPTSLPGLFVELGTLLAQFADASEAARPPLQRQIETRLKRAGQRLGL